jgi:Raf kinase inhibitor-like YbhB/YbcL family protein
MYNIPISATMLKEGIEASAEGTEGAQGKNSFGKIGYGGPMPPVGDGPHRYAFNLYALDIEKVAPPGAELEKFFDVIEDHVIESAETVGKYERSESKEVSQVF